MTNEKSTYEKKLSEENSDIVEMVKKKNRMLIRLIRTRSLRSIIIRFRFISV